MSTQTESIDRPVTCWNCETTNEQVFTYCRRCLEELPARPNAGPQ
jgi:hypothetical protein